MCSLSASRDSNCQFARTVCQQYHSWSGGLPGGDDSLDPESLAAASARRGKPAGYEQRRIIPAEDGIPSPVDRALLATRGFIAGRASPAGTSPDLGLLAGAGARRGEPAG